MRALAIGLSLVAVVWVLLVAAAWAWQERIVWQPPPHAQSQQGMAALRLDYTASDGQRLHAYLVGDPSHARGLLIAFHGNAELAVWNIGWAQEVERRTGWAVLLPEYRGYGGLPGTPSYAGSGHDADAAWRLAQAQPGADPARIAYYGSSLGTAVASELAARHPPTVLLLHAPFTSAREMSGGMGLPLLPVLWPLIGRVAFDTRARVATLHAPVWVAHGARDAVIPAHMGRAVHAAARVKGELLLMPSAGHNDVLDVAGGEYWRWLERGLTVNGGR